MAAPSGPDNFSRPQYTPTNHIDLTLDDDDAPPDQYNSSRYAKRARTDASRQDHGPPAFFIPSSSTMTTTLSPFTSRPPSSKPAFPASPMSASHSSQSPFTQYPSFVSQPAQSSYRPLFAGPPPFLPPRQQQQVPPPPPSRSPSYQLSSQQSQSQPSQSHYEDSQPRDRQVIDLTGSPSPPPPTPISRQGSQPPLPPELPPKTPVCIGQLTVNALVLYPVPFLSPQIPGEMEWAYVRLQYEHNPNKATGKETIHIKTPSGRGLNGESIPGEVFGVVEQKVADFLGPMLGKGLIRLDAKIRKHPGSLPILPLQMLVYTPKGNIVVVGNYLRQSSLFLQDPASPYDMHRLTNYHYFNPHHDLLDGQHRPIMAANTLSLIPRDQSRWTTPTSTGKSVEVQRSQVDELFKSLKDGDELAETEPSPEVATSLYPHQKKALTFLLEREREKIGTDGFSSLWQKRFNPSSFRTTWFHLVTQKEAYEAPQEAKGAILADDMGLGKTITCVSLIAATHASSLAFAASPLDVIPPPPPRQDGPNASHFAGSVWGMPDTAEGSASSSAKAKAKIERLQEKFEADYARSCRIKAKSRATLIICPLSTVSNWEDQFREHWKGEVSVIGGSGGPCVPPSLQQPPSSQSSSSSQSAMLVDEKEKVEEEKPKRVREGRPLRVYIYHGNARRPDPSFLADFDAVITTYATLASEFSKQSRSLLTADDEEDEGASSEGQGGVDIDEQGNQVLRLPKPKKGGMKRKKAMLATANNPAEIPSALQSIHWFRVVLDEAHSIKETGTVASRACCDLMADRRLCLTGTPVQNKLDDVFALIKFLRLEPFDDKNTWTEFIGSPVKFGQPLGVARLQTIMKCITLRRTKESKAPDGKKILSLPPRRDELRYLKFDEQEQDIYNKFFNESKAEFNDLTKKNEVMKNYVGILQKILRLRQICDHFELVEGKGLGQESAVPSYDDIVTEISREGFSASRAAAIFAILRESATTQCVECGGELCVSTELNPDGLDNDGPPASNKRGRRGKGPASRGPTRASSPNNPRPVLTRCQHLFCIECYRNSVCPGWPNVAPDVRRSCSACQTGLCPTDAYEVKPDSALEGSQKKKVVKREKRQKGVSLENFHPSTKFSRMNQYSVNYDPEIQIIEDTGTSDSGIIKTVVFSQWTTMLDKVEDALEAAGIRYDRLDGTMKRDDRTRAMDALKHDPGCEVLLVSLKAGGVGLNLTAAQRVYLMDPYWNPAVENQAVDRIHRLGQTRPVTTVKFIIENSIEARLLEVQRKKTELANMTLGQNFSKADLLQRRMEELSQLFGS
ncbi:SNF2 family N-terminal domain-containing protein [Flammula alnicola]|nr:SNF2 family N-terminal domain-containing protein [Flammula alnicola]